MNYANVFARKGVGRINDRHGNEPLARIIHEFGREKAIVSS